MKTVLHKAETRGSAEHEWLSTRYSFSFANYYNPARMNFGTLRVVNDDIIQAAMGFGLHPHDNMEIITIPLEGALQHKDNMGHTEIIKQGDVQVMSAGTGLYHSEFNASKEDPVKLLQIWVYPKLKGVKPRYDQRTFLESERKNKFQIIVSPDSAEALQINQDAWFTRIDLDENKEAVYSLKKEGNGIYFFVIEGAVALNGEILQKRDALGVSECKEVKIESKSNLKLLIMEIPMKN